MTARPSKRGDWSMILAVHEQAATIHRQYGRHSTVCATTELVVLNLGACILCSNRCCLHFNPHKPRLNSLLFLAPCHGCAHAWQWCVSQAKWARHLGTVISLGACCSFFGVCLKIPSRGLAAPPVRRRRFSGGVRVIHALQPLF